MQDSARTPSQGHQTYAKKEIEVEVVEHHLQQLNSKVSWNARFQQQKRLLSCLPVSFEHALRDAKFWND